MLQLEQLSKRRIKSKLAVLGKSYFSVEIRFLTYKTNRYPCQLYSNQKTKYVNWMMKHPIKTFETEIKFIFVELLKLAEERLWSFM